MNKKLKNFLKSDIGFVLIAFVIWRFLLFFIGWLASVHFDFVPRPHSFNDDDFFKVWSNWDGGHYIHLAVHGYIVEPIRTVFFPLYPLVIKFIAAITRLDQVISGLIISSASLIMTGFWLIKLIKLDYSKKIARLSFILLLIFPSAVFLGSVYTESLFLMTTIGALYYARKKNWWAALLLGFGAGLTRNLGAFLVFPLLYEYYKQYKFKLRWPFLAAGGPGYAIVAYMAYLWATFGDPLKFLHGQINWNREIVVNVFYRYYEAIVQYLNVDNDPMRLMEIVFVSYMVLMIILMFIKKLRPTYIIWSIIIFLIPIMQSHWMSVNRFMLIIFPAYLILALYAEKYKFFKYFLFILFVPFLIFHITLFVNLAWIG